METGHYVCVKVYDCLWFLGGGGVLKLACPHTGIDGVVQTTKTLMDMASAGEDGITLQSAVKFAKLCYCYEQLDAFIGVQEQLIAKLCKLAEESVSLHFMPFYHSPLLITIWYTCSYLL